MVKTQEHAKKIFYIERGDFLRKMMEFALKQRGAEIYTVETLENNFYLLDDLVPDLIIFDVKTVGDHLENLRSYRPKALLVAVGEEVDRSQVEGIVSLFLTKPLEAATIAQSILGLLD
jgi:DNA-binding response OmpR family regulator